MADVIDLMERFPAFVMEQQELEEKLESLAREGDWEEAINVLSRMPREPHPAVAEKCMACAVHSAGMDAMSRLLTALHNREYAWEDYYLMSFPELKSRSKRCMLTVNGTALMHAIAEERGLLQSLLLSHGYDPNCASPNAAEALLRSASGIASCYGENYSPIKEYSARAESRICLAPLRADTDRIAPLEIEGATPLALAMLMGKPGAVRQLIEGGAWTQAPSVSRCMYLYWREKDEEYRAAREEILKTGMRPVLQSACCCCSPKQLSQLLCSFEYSRDERIAAAKAMLIAYRFQSELWDDEKERWQDLCHRLALLRDVIEAPEVLGELLLCCADDKNAPLEPLIPYLRGKTICIDCVGTMLFGLNRRENAEKFKLLAENCRLEMHRDAVFGSLPMKSLKLLLKHVNFLPAEDIGGVSGLSIAILRTGDMRLISRALKEGLIPPEESTQDLLLCQKKLELPSGCRSLLLTRPEIPKEDASPSDIVNGRMFSRWYPIEHSRDSQPLVTEGDEKWFYPALQKAGGLAVMESAGLAWHIEHALTGLCATGRTELVRRWLQHQPGERSNIDVIHSPKKEMSLILTPLATAAFFGQNETIRLLLELGAGADEEKWGYPGVFCYQEGGVDMSLPITPIMCAMLAGHTDTVELLMEHGAEMDGFKEFYDKQLNEFKK